MRRVLLKSPAFVMDLRAWLKSHPQMATALEATLEQLSADSLYRRCELTSCEGRWQIAGPAAQATTFEYVTHEKAEAILLQALGTHDQVY